MMEREVKAEAAGDDVKEEGEDRKLGGHDKPLVRRTPGWGKTRTGWSRPAGARRRARR